MPRRCERALDIGCGIGGFSRQLATIADSVEAIDRDPSVVDVARVASVGTKNLHFSCAEFMAYTSGMSSRYDFVCALSSLHHFGEAAAFQRIASLLRPGGVFGAIGLYRSHGISDLLWSLAAFPVSLMLRFMKRPVAHGVPLRDPSLTLSQLRLLVGAYLPGATIRRRLLWRYTLLYHAPDYQNPVAAGDLPPNTSLQRAELIRR